MRAGTMQYRLLRVPGYAVGLAVATTMGIVACLLPTESVPRLHFSLADTTIIVPVGARLSDPVAVLDANGRTVASVLTPSGGARVTLSSDKPGTVAVDSSGGILGLRRGIAVIGVSYSSAAGAEPVTGSFRVHAVANAIKIMVPMPDTLTALDDTLRLATILLDGRDSVLRDTAKVAWKGLNPSVATVDSVTGLVSAVANGKAAFVATVVWDGVSSSEDTVTVVQRVARVIVTPPDTALHALHDTLTFAALAQDSNGHAVVPAPAVTWTCAPDSVVACDPKGVATAIGNGEATVTATTSRAPLGVPVTAVARVGGRLDHEGASARQRSKEVGPPSPPPTRSSQTGNAPTTGTGSTVSGVATLVVQQRFGSLIVDVQPADSDSAGIAFSRQPVVQVADRNKYPLREAGDTIRASIGSAPGSGAVLRGDTVQVTDSTGEAQFTALSIGGVVGRYTLGFTASGTASVPSDTLRLVPGRPAELKFVQQPTTAVAADTIRPAVTVQIKDAFGNVRVGDSETRVRLSIASGTGAPGAAIFGITEVAADSGFASFAALLVDSVGLSYRLAGAAIGASSASSDSFAVVPASISVTPAGASVSGVGTTQTFSAEARDAKGNTVGAPFTWSTLNANVGTVNPVTGVAAAVESGQTGVCAEVEVRRGCGLLTVAVPGGEAVNLWAEISRTAAGTLFELWGASASDVYGVGFGGQILRYNGGSWMSMSSATTQHLHGVWGTSSSDVFTVGSNGTIRHYDGSSWASMNSGTTVVLAGIWGASSTDVYVVGASGTILRYDGRAWTPMASGTTVPLQAIWGTSRADVFAVGPEGTILHFDGASWTVMSTGTTYGLNAVWGTSPSNVYAVGDGGTIIRYNGTAWNAMNSGTYGQLVGVWGSSTSDVYAVGCAGVLRYDGASWSEISSGDTGGCIRSAWGTSRSDVLLVAGPGSSGQTILRGVRSATVTVRPASTMLGYIGVTAHLTTEARDQAQNPVGGVGFTWSSGDQSVAAVDDTGLVIAVGAGTATITASAPGGTSGSATVSVRGFASVAAGSSTAGHTCGVMTDGSAFCWGAGGSGRLGNGSISGSTTPVAVAGGHTFSSVSAGLYHTCGVTSAGEAYCWGEGTSGQLGTGGSGSGYYRTTPVAVSGGHTFALLSAGRYHTCGITTAGTAYCWGEGEYGRLGNGSTSPSAIPVAVAGGHIFTSVSAGLYHTCGVTDAGEGYCWGAAFEGALGNGIAGAYYYSSPVLVSGGYAFSSVAASLYYTCGLTTGGAAYCWGHGSSGQLGNGSSGSSYFETTPIAVTGGHQFASLTSGVSHSCGATTVGEAYCWGDGANGQLGNASSSGSSVPVAVSGGHTFVWLSAGGLHTCGATAAGAAYCWGYGSSGQLGNGSTSNSSTPVPVAPPPYP